MIARHTVLKRRSAALFCAALIFICAFAQAAPRTNDFTSANTSFTKTMPSEKWSGDKPLSGDMQKDFPQMKFTPADNAAYLKEKTPNMGDSAAAKSLQAEQYSDRSKNYTTPQLPDKPSDKFYKSPNNPNFENSDKNLSKEYLGKIDVDQRNQNNKLLREAVGNMQTNSLRDINKFFSGKNGEDSGIIPVTTAGSQINKDSVPPEDGILQTLGLSSDKNVGRPAISLNKSQAFGGIKPARKEEAQPQNPQPQSAAPRPPAALEYVSAPSQQTNAQGASNVKTVAEQTVENKSKTGFLGLPKDMSGKTTIKVQVKDP